MNKEFMNPLIEESYLSIQHIERYKFAYRLIKKLLGKNRDIKILDIACGYGYGSVMLNNLGFIVGADYDYYAVLGAKRHMGVENVVQANALSLPFKDESFDVVVSFETIEHVDEGELFVEEMKRVLKEGGIFICSTPNVKYTAHPPFHLKEYAPEEFYELLSNHFNEVERYAQYFSFVDRINDLANWYIKKRIVKILDTLGIKNAVKMLLKKRKNVINHNNEQYKNQNFLHDLVNSKIHDKYGVKSYRGNSLLRIMVAVCRK